MKEKIEEILLGILYKDKFDDGDIDKILSLFKKEEWQETWNDGFNTGYVEKEIKIRTDFKKELLTKLPKKKKEHNKGGLFPSRKIYPNIVYNSAIKEVKELVENLE